MLLYILGVKKRKQKTVHLKTVVSSVIHFSVSFYIYDFFLFCINIGVRAWKFNKFAPAKKLSAFQLVARETLQMKQM